MPEPPVKESTGSDFVLSAAPTHNRAQDAFEEMREVLRRIGVTPSQMRVDWGTESTKVSVLIGRLDVLSVLKVVRCLKAGILADSPRGILEDRPYRPLLGEAVSDKESGDTGEVVGYVLRSVESGESWTAGADDIRRPDRDYLIRLRMRQLDLDARSKPPMPEIVSPQGNVS